MTPATTLDEQIKTNIRLNRRLSQLESEWQSRVDKAKHHNEYLERELTIERKDNRKWRTWLTRSIVLNGALLALTLTFYAR